MEIVGDKKDFSKLDPQTVLKSVHQDESKSLRINQVNSQVPPAFSRFELTTNTDGSVTNAKFYYDSEYETTEVRTVADVGGNLNNKYFFLYSALDETKYHVWYNVGGTGLDPAPAGSTGIMVAINSNDGAAVVALATKFAIGAISDFDTSNNYGGNYILVVNTAEGASTNANDFNTGFSFNVTNEGISELSADIDLPYVNGTRYIFNEAEGIFEVFPTQNIDIDIDEPNEYEILNLAIANKNVEVSQVLPDNTKRYTISVRDGKSRLRLADTSGATATRYKTIERGVTWESKNTDIPNGTTLYFLSTQDAVVVEIEVWKRT